MFKDILKPEEPKGRCHRRWGSFFSPETEDKLPELPESVEGFPFHYSFSEKPMVKTTLIPSLSIPRNPSKKKILNLFRKTALGKDTER